MTMAIQWPSGKRFAFTIFDDADKETVANVGAVYQFLADCGFRTTKSMWVVRGDPNKGFNMGETSEDADYLQWLLELQAKGFEIGWHNSTWHGLPREQIAAALDTFARFFGHFPLCGANHSDHEGIYWGDSRLTGWRRLAYNFLTRFRNHNRYFGHVDGNEYFWGDLCREKIKYYRNFVYRDVNTLKACPIMPYFDPIKPYVNHWFASSDGHDVLSFNQCLSEENQDRLEAEGGACVMYTHFAFGFFVDGKLNPRFRELMLRLSKKDGWFVPTATLLDYLLKAQETHQLTPQMRRRLERKWLREKIFTGTN